jgi:hypothetical protein
MRAGDEPVVAQVVLKPHSGQEITGDSILTQETLHEFLPDRADAETVARSLADAGFDVGPLVGIAMSITGPRLLFERYFHTSVSASEEGGWVAGHHQARRELPPDSLPRPLAERVHAIVFEPPTETTT